MATVIPLSPSTAYVTSPNCKFPGTQAAATAHEAAAKTRIEDTLVSGVTVTVAGGTVKLAA